jgi:Tfp pilus assembly protein PilN
MINLLPPDYAMRIRFGRRNSILLSWIIGALVAIGGLLVIIAGGWIYLNQQSSQLQRSLQATDSQLKAQNIDRVQKDAAEISGDIKAINTILGSEVRFSSLIQDIGRVMPPGSVLSTLSLSKINGAIDLSANARDYASAAQIAVNLNDPANGLFSKVDIENISCLNDPTKQYKCTGTFKALFNDAAQKKYLSVPAQDKKS